MVTQAGINTPYVKLDKENCTLSIMGKCYPENPTLFYKPIFEEINKCKEHLTNPKITFKIALEVINSVSTKYLFYLVKVLHESPSSELEIYWYYEHDDECMFDEGNYFKTSLPKLNFHLVEVDDLRKIK
jgi:hypothetical protein